MIGDSFQPSSSRGESNQAPKAARKFSQNIPQLALPKTSGTIKGIGEKFTLSPATGSGTAIIPIAMVPMRGAPELMLSYDSGNGNGPFGLGWSLGFSSISRKTERRLPTYGDDDVFVLSGLEDLVPVKSEKSGNTKITTYLPRTEGGFSWIRQFVNGAANWWLTIDRNNVRRWYGAYPDPSGSSVIANDTLVIQHPTRPQHIFSWLLAEERDDRGNQTRFRYKREDNSDVDPLAPWEQNRTATADALTTCLLSIGRLQKLKPG